MNCKLLVVLAAALVGCQSEILEENAKPGINDAFLADDLQVSNFVERFEREGREIYEQREDIVAALDLQPGMEVADIGAGTGLFTPMLADAVGEEGRVYAVDIAPKFLALVEERCADRSNVETVLASDRDCQLDSGSVDLAFLCDTYHHFEYPRNTSASLFRAIRPGGKLALIDFERIEGVSSDWILGHVRAGREVFRREIEEAGFRFHGERKLLEENYFLLFERP